ncbi:MAG: hypothetical protein CLLPBCKN_005916 [Chroococcidiopsis cubana SAG 39.79]|uniref:Uncharacterized protein n=1 Tax=Chroococcidiopsis thermalis (strain PCC 7203) TaxID=251229 RepID=K9U8U6_CHRTP|nr:MULTISPECIES: hypothetical protein [Chroococcidiopsis]AFY90846.1 hypothetical protein Chro_5486 [Chroococcidiopsis thermalis PCC 7203]MDZ4876496.1 hypothetical protein [Chroococcidiopsis cubana SAG 39.79]URD50375.1 hypothetical protein M5J74_29260 [Chroococcidiopsis sp. CCNUC1]
MLLYDKSYIRGINYDADNDLPRQRALTQRRKARTQNVEETGRWNCVNDKVLTIKESRSPAHQI